MLRGASFPVWAMAMVLTGAVLHGVAARALASAPERAPSPTLRMPLAPASGWEPALGALRFSNPVVVTSPPGESNRLFVVEQPGRIVVITNLARPTRTVFLDLTTSTVSGGEQGLLGLTFHPDFARNGRFFVFRTLTATTRGATNRLHDRLSEFRVVPTEPNRASTFEIVIFQQFDEAGNHNGGDLHFGPDGLLYVSLGDEGGANDQYGNGQTITRDFFAGILRLDVDGRRDSLPPNPHPANEASLSNYWIPADNPFVGATRFLGREITDPGRVRTEFYAVGLRNPWRMAFDRVTGELWVADVGQGARESIFLTRRGANHGWPYREGPLAGPRAGAPAGFTTNAEFGYVAPLYAYSHGSGSMQGRSVTGGFVYRGTRFPALFGAYVFADYVSGNVWALRRTDGAAPRVERLLGEGGLSAFGPDPRDGDVLAADLDGGRVLRLVPGATSGQALPATLAETGAFGSTRDLVPATGVVPYEVNLPFWSDGAEKRRWFHVPGTDRFSYRAEGQWSAPVGTVWVKHFDLPLGSGTTATRQRVETRFLVRNVEGVYGVTYRWNSATNAVLVSDEGEEAVYRVEVAGGGSRDVTWRFPSRAECLTCHNAAAGGSLSFETAQLARDVSGPEGRPRDQVAALVAAGYLAGAPSHAGAGRRHPAAGDETTSLEARARSYLAVNCAPCHRGGGALGGGFFDARLETPTTLSGILDGPLNDSRGDPGARVVVPGDPGRSELWRRIVSTGSDRMPPVSSGQVDPDGVALLERWIRGLPARVDFPGWLATWFGPGGADAADTRRDHDGDGASTYLEFLADTDPTRAGDGWRLSLGQDPRTGRGTLRYRHPAHRVVGLEIARDPVQGPWEAWAPVERSPGPPARAQDIEVPLPEDDGPWFIRARLAEL